MFAIVLWQRAFVAPTPVAWQLCFTGGKDIGNQVWLCVCSQQWLVSPSQFLCHWAGLSGLLPRNQSFSWLPCGGRWRRAGKWAQIPVMDRAPGWEAGMLASTFWEFIKHLASFFLFIVLWLPCSLLVGHVCSLLKFLVWLPCNLNNLWWAQ